MPWFRVDDGFCMHAKVVQAGNSAIGLWVRAGSWSAQQLTDGFVPDAMIPALGAVLDDAQRLVDVGLWETVDGGYRFWQWTERQPTRAQVEAERESARARMRRSRQAKRTSSQRSASDRADERSTGNKADGAPLPDGFPLTEQMKTWAASVVPDVNIEREHAQFCDYFRARIRSREPDWNARWRRWMRDAQTRAEARPKPRGGAERDVPSTVLWTPEAPPPEIADDPVKYSAWIRDQRKRHKEAS